MAPPHPRRPLRHAPRCRCCNHLPQSSFEVTTPKRIGKENVKTSGPAPELEAGPCRAGHNRPATCSPFAFGLHPRPDVVTTNGQRKYLPSHLSSVRARRHESTTLCRSRVNARSRAAKARVAVRRMSRLADGRSTAIPWLAWRGAVGSLATDDAAASHGDRPHHDPGERHPQTRRRATMAADARLV